MHRNLRNFTQIALFCLCAVGWLPASAHAEALAADTGSANTWSLSFQDTRQTGEWNDSHQNTISGSAVPCSSSYSYYYYYCPTDGLYTDVNTGAYDYRYDLAWGQTFTAQASGDLSRVQVPLSRSGHDANWVRTSQGFNNYTYENGNYVGGSSTSTSTCDPCTGGPTTDESGWGDILVEVYALTPGSVPTGDPLATSVIPASALAGTFGTTPTAVSANFPAGMLQLVGGTQYAVVLRNLGLSTYEYSSQYDSVRTESYSQAPYDYYNCYYYSSQCGVRSEYTDTYSQTYTQAQSTRAYQWYVALTPGDAAIQDYSYRYQQQQVSTHTGPTGDYVNAYPYDYAYENVSQVYWYTLSMQVYVEGGDDVDPTASIVSPAEGETYARGASVTAQYRCADEDGGSGVATCVGTLANGAAVATDELGSFAFTVTATDVAGNESRTTSHYSVVDTTDPTISLTSPTNAQRVGRGANLTASFSCADEQGGSGISECAGTSPTGSQLDTTQLGTFSFTVTARDAAGNHVARTVQYTVEDETSPSITLGSPTEGQLVARGSRLAASFSCIDEPGGSGLATCASEVENDAEIDTATLGAHTLVVRATDQAGNAAERSVTYTVVDRDAPTVTIASPLDGQELTRGGSAPAAYECADEVGGSGLVSCVGTVPPGTDLDTADLGGHSFAVTATDRAGNITSQTVSYTVVDRTVPMVGIATPADGQEINLRDEVLADYWCTDEAGGSGLDSCLGTAVFGSPIATRVLGSHQFTVRAADNAGNTAQQTVGYSVVDHNAPSIDLTSPSEGQQVGRGTSVAVGYTCTDDEGGSGIASCTGDVPTGGALDSAALGDHTFSVTARDVAGNVARTTVHYTVVDVTKPTVAIASPTNHQVVVLGSRLNAAYTCTDEQGGSGLDSCIGNVAAGSALDTSTVGARSFTVTATDRAGNTSATTYAWSVVYAFSGFSSPVEGGGAVNAANGGQTIPVKFSLAGNQGLSAVAAGYPRSQRGDCTSFALLGEAEAASATDANGLKYTGGQYHYNWKTEKAYAGTCRVLSVKLADGTMHTAKFRFK